jgi:3-mercaptopyruvate sulfurtransferase SseA
MASWLAMLGWDVSVWDDAFEATNHQQNQAQIETQTPDSIDLLAEEIEKHVKAGALLIDLRPSMQYRAGHIKSAIWSIRPQLHQMAEKIKEQTVILLSEEKTIASLAAIDLKELGAKTIYINTQKTTDWEAAHLPIENTPNNPPDEKCIDYLFFVHDRHDGNKVAARQYLAWEINLLAQIDEQEKAGFKLPH